MTDLLVATTNAGKQREFSRLLSGLPGRRVTPAQIGVELDVDEPYETYAENAAAKATAFARASGLLTLADDSGLETAALDWGPGVRTGRFGGPAISDRAAYLLEQIRGSGRREARMVCVLALGIPGPAEPQIELFEGRIEGAIATGPRGTGGFGYDPIFELPSGLTTAQLDEVEKDRLSHRGLAVAAAWPRLLELLTD